MRKYGNKNTSIDHHTNVIANRSIFCAVKQRNTRVQGVTPCRGLGQRPNSLPPNHPHR